jgi:hypothetical protein
VALGSAPAVSRAIRLRQLYRSPGATLSCATLRGDRSGFPRPQTSIATRAWTMAALASSSMVVACFRKLRNGHRRMAGMPISLNTSSLSRSMRAVDVGENGDCASPSVPPFDTAFYLMLTWRETLSPMHH